MSTPIFTSEALILAAGIENPSYERCTYTGFIQLFFYDQWVERSFESLIAGRPFTPFGLNPKDYSSEKFLKLACKFVKKPHNPMLFCARVAHRLFFIHKHSNDGLICEKPSKELSFAFIAMYNNDTTELSKKVVMKRLKALLLSNEGDTAWVMKIMLLTLRLSYLIALRDKDVMHRIGS